MSVPTTGSADIAVLGLVGTTFVIAAAFYQAYLVRQKGWSINELQQGIVDTHIGAVVIALITVMLMATAAAGLYTGTPITLSDPIAVADALQPTFGSSASARVDIDASRNQPKTPASVFLKTAMADANSVGR